MAVEGDGHHWSPRYSLGRLLLSQTKASDALVQFEAATRMRDNAAPRLQVAKSLRALGQNESAWVILNDLLTYPPNKFSKSFVRVGEPESRLPVELQLGLLESSLQNWSDALPWLQMVLKDDPQLLEARYSLAISLRSLGRHDDAQREFQQVARAREVIAEADRLVDEVIGRSEPCVAERCRIGELFLTYESRQRGEFWLRETLRRDPDYAPAHRLLAGYYAELAQKDPSYLEQAERHRRAAAVAPESDSPTATGFVPEGSNPSQ